MIAGGAHFNLIVNHSVSAWCMKEAGVLQPQIRVPYFNTTCFTIYVKIMCMHEIYLGFILCSIFCKTECQMFKSFIYYINVKDLINNIYYHC